MKDRLLSAGIGLVILFTIFFFNQTYVFNLAIALVGAIGVHEMLSATKKSKNKSLTLCGILFALIFPFTCFYVTSQFATLLIFAFFAVLFIIMLSQHEKVKFEDISVVFMSSLFVSFAMSTIVFIRDSESEIAMYYIVLIFAIAWIADAGAYFVGRAFGKHKLAPKISPKKTIEGAVGGVLVCLIFNVLFTIGYIAVMGMSGVEYKMNTVALIILSLVGAVIGILGDLSASTIKRQYGIKDFGNLMPGHGGVIDRFDSVLLVAPFVFIIIQFVKIIEIV